MLEHSSVGPPHFWEKYRNTAVEQYHHSFAALVNKTSEKHGSSLSRAGPQNLEFPITYLSYIDEVEVPVLVNNCKLAFIGQTGLVQRHLNHLHETEPEFVNVEGALESIPPG
jgi:hypothetical protein